MWRTQNQGDLLLSTLVALWLLPVARISASFIWEDWRCQNGNLQSVFCTLGPLTLIESHRLDLHAARIGGKQSQNGNC